MVHPKVQNPWHQIPYKAPYVLKSDQAFIDYFNQLLTQSKPLNSEKFKIKTDHFPQPYLGRLDAPVVLLLLNPGISEGEEPPNSDVVDKLKEIYNLQVGADHWHLSEDRSDSGADWWTKLCKALINEGDTKLSLKTLSEKILSIEYSAYRSQSFGHGFLRLPSQEYTFQLVRDAIARNAYIVCLRGERYWRGAIAELAYYEHFCCVKNPRSASLSERNLPDGKYEQLKQILKFEI